MDEFQTEAFVQLVDDICGKTDTSVVYISHYENEVPACVSCVLELEEGNGLNHDLYDYHDSNESSKSDK